MLSSVIIFTGVYIPDDSKKNILLLLITSPNVDQFSQFFNLRLSS